MTGGEVPWKNLWKGHRSISKTVGYDQRGVRSRCRIQATDKIIGVTGQEAVSIVFTGRGIEHYGEVEEGRTRKEGIRREKREEACFNGEGFRPVFQEEQGREIGSEPGQENDHHEDVRQKTNGKESRAQEKGGHQARGSKDRGSERFESIIVEKA